jgi:hypothetical protein
MYFFLSTKKLQTYLSVFTILSLLHGCSYPDKHVKQGECLNGSHRSYFYEMTRTISRVSFGPHLVVSIMLFPFALIMLPLSVAIDTIRLPVDIWMEARFHSKCSTWMEDPNLTCEEFRTDSINKQQAMRSTGPDDPTDRIPVCLCKKEPAQKGFPANVAPRTSSPQMTD